MSHQKSFETQKQHIGNQIMKTKLYWFALLASAALIGQAQAGGHHSGGGGNFVAAAPLPARSGAPSSFHSAPMRSFGGGRTIYSGQRFSAIGPRSLSRAPLRRSYIAPSGATSIRPRQFTPRNISHADSLTRFSD